MLGGRAQNKFTLCSLSCCKHKGLRDAPQQHPAGVLPSPASGSHGLHASCLGLWDSSFPQCWPPSQSWFASRQLLGLHTFIVGPGIAEYSPHRRGRLQRGASELVSGRGRLHRVIQRDDFPSPLKPYSENSVSEAILMSSETHITALRPALYVCMWLCRNTTWGMSFHEPNSSAPPVPILPACSQQHASAAPPGFALVVVPLQAATSPFLVSMFCCAKEAPRALAGNGVWCQRHQPWSSHWWCKGCGNVQNACSPQFISSNHSANVNFPITSLL